MSVRLSVVRVCAIHSGRAEAGRGHLRPTACLDQPGPTGIPSGSRLRWAQVTPATSYPIPDSVMLALSIPSKSNTAGTFQMRSTLSRQLLTNLKILQLGSEHSDPRTSVNSRILTITARSPSRRRASLRLVITSARNVRTRRDWAS